MVCTVLFHTQELFKTVSQLNQAELYQCADSNFTPYKWTNKHPQLLLPVSYAFVISSFQGLILSGI